MAIELDPNCDLLDSAAPETRVDDAASSGALTTNPRTLVALNAEVEELFALNAEVEPPFAVGNMLLPFVLHADIPTVKSKENTTVWR